MKYQDEERQALVNDIVKSYGDASSPERPSSRLDWAESSWTRWIYVVTWWWLNPLLQLANKRTLTDHDLDDLSQNDKGFVLMDRLRFYTWTASTSTWKVIVRVFWKEYLAIGLFVFPLMTARIAQPLLLREIVLRISNKPESLAVTYVYVVLLFICALLPPMLNQQIIFRSMRVGLRIRNALTGTIYARLLSTKIESLQKTITAPVINLVAQDATRFMDASRYLHFTWSAVLEAIIIFGILCWIIGPLPALFGYVVLILIIPTQLYFSRKFSQYRLTRTIWTDKRILAFSGFVQGCHTIKMYNWEEMMQSHINEIRQGELAVIRRASYFHALNMSQYFLVTPLLTFASVGFGWLIGSAPAPADVFAATSYFVLMRTTIAFFLIRSIENLSGIQLASERIDTFMRLTKMEEQQAHAVSSSSSAPQEKGRIVMSNASFSWNSDQPCLSALTITIEPGTFVGIVGGVGSGKSSFLSAILDEVHLTDGELHTNHSSFSYAAQSSWIFADTLRNNILLGKPFDPQRYTEVLHACCLDVDVSAFGARGDLIMIGEKGVNLSGGQKSRVSLARALYADADVYLLDDPLAAVDRTVAQRIYQRCLGPHGLLKEKTRLLVTHQTQFLGEASQIIFLAHGHIDEAGQLHHNGTTLDGTEQATTKENSLLADMLDLNSSSVDTQSIVAEEVAVSGNASWSLWCRLFTASPLGWFGVCLLVVLMVATEAIYDGVNYWVRTVSIVPDVAPVQLRTDFYIYLGLIAALVLLDLCRAKYFFYLILHGANRLHNTMLHGLLYTSIQFFESNPAGRILNRASNDQQVIDETLPPILLNAIESLLLVVGAATVICIINPFELLVFIPLIPIIWFLCRFYVRSNRQIKRLEVVTRSPVYALFSSCLNGLSTIRAFRVEKDFRDLFLDRLDANARAYIIMISAMQWLSVRLDFLASLFLLITAILIVAFHKHMQSATAGLCLMYTITLIGLLQWGVRQLLEAENFMISAERIDEYAQLTPEEDEGGQERLAKTAPDWPSQGTIEFRNYSLRYRPDLDPVLKNITVRIESGQKIGVIGRTGAGKSSLFNGLFRFIHRSCVDGQILVDDVDISRVTLHHLRSHFSVIPQQPMLFSGTLRFNLDPFNQCSDEQCFMALEDVQLKYLIDNHPAGLLFHVAEMGSNLSTGECQLVCVARAILTKSQVLLIDEATANVDQRTDDILQKVIAEKFQNQTVITIAHRLDTVAKNDRILVLDEGTIVNFDTPATILQNYQ